MLPDNVRDKAMMRDIRSNLKGACMRSVAQAGSNKVRLDLKLNAGAKAFVKKDSYATIRPEGLVGNYYVDVTVGSPVGEQIEDGDVIRSREAIRLTDVLENTDAIVRWISIERSIV